MFALVAGCGPVVIGNGKVVTVTHEVPAFSQLSVGGSIDLTVTVGELSVLTLTGEENVLEAHDVLVRDGVLEISPKDRMAVQPTKGISGSISVPRLDAIDASGATTVRTGVLESQNAVGLVGSGSATIITGTVTAARVNVAASGSSEIRTVGSTPLLRVDASGASDVEAGELASEVLELDASGSASVTAHATKEVRGSASGASDVTVVGSPAVRDIARSGSTSISFP